MNSKSFISKLLVAAIGLTFNGLLSNSEALAGNLHSENSYENGSVVALSLGNSHVESIAKWRVPDGKQKAIVLSLHGFGLHKCVYQQLAEHLQAVGVSTYAMDVRGFGSWSKSAGADSRFNPNKTLSDVKTALATLREENPDTPIFLLGESLGGALALNVAAQNPELVDGVIASVPAAERYQAKRTAFSLLLKNLVGNGAHINIGKRLIGQATNNESLKQLWQADPSARLTVSTSELITFSRFMHHNHKVASQITGTSVLVLQGANDRLVKPAATRKLFNELRTNDKDFLLVDNSEHLILEEGQCDTNTFRHIGTWLNRHEELKLASLPAISAAQAAKVDQEQIVVALVH